MKKLFIFLYYALSSMTVLNAETLNLEECIGRALMHNPDIRKSGYSRDQSRISTRQVWSDLLPGVSVNASSSNSGQVVSEMNDNWSWTVGGSVSQPIYSPGLFTRISLARVRQRSAEYLFGSNEDQIRASVEKLYYQILTSDTLIAVYEANIHLATEQMSKMKQMVELGMKRESDLLKSEVQRGTFEAQLVRETESQASALRNLNLLMGRDPDQELMIRSLDVDRIQVPDFETASAIMLDCNPQLKNMKSGVDVQKLSLRIAKEAFLPSVHGSYSYSRRKDALGGTAVENEQVQVGLSLSLFEGFTKFRNVQLSNLDLKSAQLDYETTLRELENLLLNQYKALEMQNRLITIHQTNLASAHKDLEVVSQQYVSGFSSILDLMDAQVSVFESEAGLLQDLYTRKTIESEIRRLIGP